MRIEIGENLSEVLIFLMLLIVFLFVCNKVSAETKQDSLEQICKERGHILSDYPKTTNMMPLVWIEDYDVYSIKIACEGNIKTYPCLRCGKLVEKKEKCDTTVIYCEHKFETWIDTTDYDVYQPLSVPADGPIERIEDEFSICYIFCVYRLCEAKCAICGKRSLIKFNERCYTAKTLKESGETITYLSNKKGQPFQPKIPQPIQILNQDIILDPIKILVDSTYIDSCIQDSIRGLR